MCISWTSQGGSRARARDEYQSKKKPTERVREHRELKVKSGNKKRDKFQYKHSVL